MLRVQLSSSSLTSQLSASELISNGSIVSSTEDAKDVYHFCLGTTSQHNTSGSNAGNGILFRVGRKDADVEFTNEKSVSRQHCRVRIVSSAASTSSATAIDGMLSPTKKSRKRKDSHSIDHPQLNTHASPSTEDERNACESTSDGIILVLEDLGSKFGTRIYYDKSHDSTANKATLKDNNASDDDTENDETDDEQFPTSSQIQQSSSVPSLLNFDTDSHTMKTVEKNGHLILHCLSLRDNWNHERQSAIAPLSVVVQCGSAHFTISRVPMEFCTSRISATSKKKLESIAPSIGATMTNFVNPHTMTHLIAPDQMSSAKNISAWIMNVPVVTEEYVYALADRKKGNDPMPNVEDYTCQKVESEFMFDDPERKTAQLSVADRQKILSGYKILNLNDSHPEIENMCKCAGASVVHLYKKVNGKVDVKFWQNREFFEGLKMEQEKDSLELVWLDPGNATKLKKGKDYLVKMTKDGPVRLSCIDMFQGAAKAIQDVNDLIDIDGRPIVRNPPPLDLKNDRPAKQLVMELKDLQRDDDTNDVIMDQVQQNMSTANHSLDLHESVIQKEMPVDSSIPSRSDDVNELRNDSSRKRKSSSQKGSDINDLSFDNHDEENEDRDNNDHSQMWQSSRNSKLSKRSKRDSQKSIGWIHSQNHQSNQDDHNDDEEQDEQVTETKTTTEPKARKTQLAQASDGWMVAAPSGKDRSKLKRSVGEMNELGEENAREAADTIRMKLVVRSKAEVETIRTSRKKNTKRNGSKDFKRFVKNSIIPGNKEHSFSGISLISVSANESHRRRELEEEEASLEKQQRAADDLFHEGGSRMGGGSIRSFFKTTATSNSRGRLKL